jgi:hypothetical protein
MMLHLGVGAAISPLVENHLPATQSCDLDVLKE